MCNFMDFIRPSWSLPAGFYNFISSARSKVIICIFHNFSMKGFWCGQAFKSTLWSHHKLDNSSVLSILNSRSIHWKLSMQISLSYYLWWDLVAVANGSCSFVPWLFWCSSLQGCLQLLLLIVPWMNPISTDFFGPAAKLSHLLLFL